ncbi:hypothetical protein [Pseudoalteromonas pernae]|uniref:hypothetical protein n=1 Tax=Pseudoalteromonas pernae TaxID=3118054 RepID=UPI003242FF92
MTHAVESKIDIYIRDDVLTDYVAFLDGRSPLSISEFSTKRIRRDVVDMILAQQALKLGGFEPQFEYHSGKINFRNTRMLEQGQLLISFDSYWLQDAQAIEEHVYISDPVIRVGEYYAGVYSHPDNLGVQQSKHIDDFAALSAVSTPRWRSDWQTLEQLPLKKLVREDEWLAQARMVSMQWVDFMLMPMMPQYNNYYQLENIALKANANLVVLIEDSRHFVISKKHPHGQQAFAALQKGLAILREQGRISKAYKEAGFIPDLTKVTVINSQGYGQKSSQE